MPQKTEGLSSPSTLAKLLAHRDLLQHARQRPTLPEVRSRPQIFINPPEGDAVYCEYNAKSARAPVTLLRFDTQTAVDADLEKDCDGRVRRAAQCRVQACDTIEGLLVSFQRFKIVIG